MCHVAPHGLRERKKKNNQDASHGTPLSISEAFLTSKLSSVGYNRFFPLTTNVAFMSLRSSVNIEHVQNQQ